MSCSDAHWILILDDDPIVTRILRVVLDQEPSFHVVTFNDPSEALESFEERSYDAVVADFLMPGMDGIEFLKRVRERKPVAARILLTGYADKQNAIRAINEVGLYHYFEKPWQNDRLLMVLRNAVERADMLRDLERAIAELDRRDSSLADLQAKLLKAIL